ncbi:hypothetical protein ACFC3F_06825 [Microbacterium sp. NPDC055910]|uniref:hypothetical protein n=1 Tax=Microbacterium sp. NPDC055910 TaxID=3345659 RepID=UPI0035DA2CB6
MSNTPPAAIIPPNDPERDSASRDDGGLKPDDPIREIDGEPTIDPDVDPDQVDSATADRIASGADPRGDRDFPEEPALTHP